MPVNGRLLHPSPMRLTLPISYGDDDAYAVVNTIKTAQNMADVDLHDMAVQQRQPAGHSTARAGWDSRVRQWASYPLFFEQVRFIQRLRAIINIVLCVGLVPTRRNDTYLAQTATPRTTTR